MSRHFLAILAAPMMLFAASSIVRAAEPTSVSSPAVNERDSFTQKAANEMQLWDAKIHDTATATLASGKHLDSQAENELNIAWNKADTAARALRNVGNDGWAAARSAYENAAADLNTAWHKVHPEAS